MIIHPLLASQQSPDFRQSRQLSGVWRRAIYLVAEGGALLTLHRRGSGFSPAGWVIRTHDFDALRAVLRETNLLRLSTVGSTGAIFAVPAASPLFVENHFPATFPAPCTCTDGSR